MPGDQIATVRNTTEEIASVLLGYRFGPGDEIVASSQDYWHMLEMCSRRLEQGVAGHLVEPPIPAPSEDAIVDAFAKVISSKTKLVLVTHISDRTGQG